MPTSTSPHGLRQRILSLAVAAALALACVPGTARAQGERPMRGGRQIKQLPKTWVVTGTFAEADPKTLTEITINAPQLMRFKWGTGWEEAEEGLWRLKRLGPRAGQEAVLATGAVSPAPGLFSIDLAPYLPTPPPASASTYHLEVVARKKGAIDKTATTMPGQSGAKLAPKELGIWSLPVVITYVASTTPITQFDLPEVYRKATIHFEKFVVVEDQSGGGQEEFHVGGFVQELFEAQGQGGRFARPGKQVAVGPDHWTTNPPMERLFKFDGQGFQQVDQWSFHLNSADADWPRRYFVGFSVLEEDDGGLVASWKADLSGIEGELVKGDVLDMGRRQLEEYLKKKLLEDFPTAVNWGSLIVDAGAEFAGSAGGPVLIASTAVVLIGIAIGAIIADMEDDDYGKNAALLTLASNRVDEVRKLPGQVVGQGANERYVLHRQKLAFAGPSLATAAVPCCDGKVEIWFHWEFSQRELE